MNSNWMARTPKHPGYPVELCLTLQKPRFEMKGEPPVMVVRHCISGDNGKENVINRYETGHRTEINSLLFDRYPY